MSRKYNSEERETWLESIYPEYKNQTWHNDQVFHPSHIKQYQFFKRAGSYTAKIDPKKIHGLEYAYGYNCPSYSSNHKIDWKYMLHWLRRLDWVIDNFKNREEIIEHIHKNSEPKEVIKFGDHYFTTGGQHRLCLAKYLDVDEVEVTINKYEFDRTLFIKEKKLERYLSKIKDYGIVEQRISTDIDNNYIILEINRNTFFLRKEFIEYLTKRYEQLKSKPYRAILNILKRAINQSDNNYFIEKEAELFLLDYHLLKHIYKQSNLKSYQTLIDIRKESIILGFFLFQNFEIH